MNRDHFLRYVRRNGDREAAVHTVTSDASRKWREHGKASLTEGQITVLCVEWFFGEVCNGGIDQYLFNQSGRMASEGPGALERVQLHEYANILRSALSRCDNHPDNSENDFGEREDYYSPDPELLGVHALDDLDRAFFTLYHSNQREFRDRLYEYILAHEEDFVEDSES